MQLDFSDIGYFCFYSTSQADLDVDLAVDASLEKQQKMAMNEQDRSVVSFVR